MKRRARRARRGAPPRPRRGMGRALWAAIALCVALLGGGAWLVGQGGGTDSTSFPATPTPVPTRTALATPIAGVPTVGRVLPSPTPMPPQTPLPLARAERLALPSTVGQALSLRSFPGKKVVLFFYEEST